MVQFNKLINYFKLFIIKYVYARRTLLHFVGGARFFARMRISSQKDAKSSMPYIPI
ncbi:MAG TPA: hypothetical protein VIK78_13750 [Ruminiclostridium sp.]